MERIGFWPRLWLALIVPWKLLFDADYAVLVRRLGLAPELAPGRAPAPEVLAEASAHGLESDPTPALQLLAILQREGRFLDFLKEDVTVYSDAEVGAAARVVHQGCKRGLADYVELEPVRAEAEGEPVTLQAGFDAACTRVTGNLVGEPPFRGTLAHHGWRVIKIRLPRLVKGHDARVVAPAEVEVA